MDGVNMTGTIRKWGNSYGIAVPKRILEEAGFKLNEEVKLTFEKKKNPLEEIFGTLPHQDIDLDKELKEIDEEFRSKYE